MVPEHRFFVGMTGQAIASLAYPFIMFLPTKVGDFLKKISYFLGSCFVVSFQSESFGYYYWSNG